MKKNNLIAGLVLFAAVVILLPFLIMWMYELGEKYPIIKTPFSASDMLSYAASITGALTGLVALIYSIISNSPRFHISHATTCNERNEECVLISIINDSLFECEILSVSITNKEHNHRAHIIRTGPFEIKAKTAKSFNVPSSQARKVIQLFKKERDIDRLFYELYLGTGGVAYLKADELLKTLDAQDAYQREYGCKNNDKQQDQLLE